MSGWRDSTLNRYLKGLNEAPAGVPVHVATAIESVEDIEQPKEQEMSDVSTATIVLEEQDPEQPKVESE